jgi:RecB family exonuclease
MLHSMETTTRHDTTLDIERTPAAVRWHSVSSTREYEGCPRRYRFGYLDKRPKDRPAPVSWRFGSAVHAGLEAGYRHLVDQPDAGLSERLLAASIGVDEAWGELGLDTDDDDEGRRRASWLVGRALARDVIVAEQVLGVEVALRGEVCEDERIIGFADLVLARDDDTLEIVDHKVTRYRATPAKLAHDFQLNLYGELARRQWPWARTVRVTHHYPLGPDAVSAVLDRQSMADALLRVHDTAATIRDDRDFVPTPSERCGHCPWLPSCAEGQEHQHLTASAG